MAVYVVRASAQRLPCRWTASGFVVVECICPVSVSFIHAVYHAAPVIGGRGQCGEACGGCGCGLGHTLYSDARETAVFSCV